MIYMELSFAPMEGVTYSIYRRLHAEMFPGADVYYSPFIAPDSKGSFKAGSLRDVLPENNGGLKLIPQILCNSAEPFLAVARELEDMGYTEVNLNAGCPSGTVVSKHKGAGMLKDLRSLDHCLEEIFSRCPIRVSVKTRMGMSSTDEFPAILEIYNQYPLSRLIIHARHRDGMYKSRPERDAFAAALPECRFPVVYNGNIFTVGDMEDITAMCPGISGVMIGRGAAANPALFRQIRGGSPVNGKEMQAFHDALLDGYLSEGLAPNFAFARMKELWFYMLCMYPGAEKDGKAILKSRSMTDYRSAVSCFFSGNEPDCRIGFNK